MTHFTTDADVCRLITFSTGIWGECGEVCALSVY